jgi:hypothetical protein
MTETYYKWLTAEHRGAYGHGDYFSYLPNGNPGKWLPKVAQPKPCVRGYHVVTVDQIAQHITKIDLVLFEVSVRGMSKTQSDKSAWESMRLVRRIGSISRDILVEFACDCADRVLPIFETRYPDDDRPRKAIAAARSGGSDTAYAANDAYAAAYAANAAAAAYGAAYAAKKAAERRWQGERLIELAAANEAV